MKIQEFLQNIGLNEKEAILYLELIKYEHLTPTEIAKKTGINRTTVYPILEQLIEKRLVREVEGSKKNKYSAESAERIRTYFEEKKAQYEEHERLLDSIVPQIKSIELKNSENNPVIKYYSGKEGALACTKDFLEMVSEGSEVSMIYSQDFIEKMFKGVDIKIAGNVRQSKSLKIKTIYTSSKGEKAPAKGSERVYVQGKDFENIIGDIAFSDNVVRFYAGDTDFFGVIIRSPQIAKTLKTLHEIAFKSLKRGQ